MCAKEDIIRGEHHVVRRGLDFFVLSASVLVGEVTRGERGRERRSPHMFAPWLPPDALRMENIIRVRGTSVGEQEDGHL